MTNSVEIFWSKEDEAFIAVDCTRPGCSAVGETEDKAMKELRHARQAWDAAKRKATAGAST